MEQSIIIEKMPDYEARLYNLLSEEHKHIYLTMRRTLDAYLLDFVASNIRYFTSHGKQHMLGVVRQLSNMLLPGGKHVTTLSSTELLVLLCSAWLHDIGLLVNRDSKGRLLSNEEIREKHHQLSHDKILEIHVEAGIHDEILADLIARVCLCHRREESIPKHLAKEQVIRGDWTHPQLLAAILRMADALDTDAQRAPKIFLDKLFELSELGQLHWQICQMTNVGYLPEKGVIHLDAVYRPKREIAETEKLTDEETRQLFLWKFNDLCEELESVKEIWQAYDMPYKRLTGALEYSKERVEVTSEEPLPENVFPLEIILYTRNKQKHLKKEEYLFAADWDYQSARFCEKEADRKSSGELGEQAYLKWSSDFYKLASKLVDDEAEKQPQGKYFLNTLKIYYALKAARLDGVLFCLGEQMFLDQIERIQRGLEWLAKSDHFDPTLQLRAGKSPIRLSLRQSIASNFENVVKGGSVHEGCAFCTARRVIKLILARRSDKAQDSIDWLCDPQTENLEWRCINSAQGQPEMRSYTYTARSLVALLEHKDLAIAEKIARLLIEKRNDWLVFTERSRERTVGDILAALGTYLRRIEKTFDSSPFSMVFEEGTCARQFIDDYHKLNYSARVDGIPGILIWREMPDTSFVGDMKRLACKTIQQVVVEDPVWDEKGAWGSAAFSDTQYRLEKWLEFWENYLLSEDMEDYPHLAGLIPAEESEQ